MYSNILTNLRTLNKSQVRDKYASIIDIKGVLDSEVCKEDFIAFYSHTLSVWTGVKCLSEVYEGLNYRFCPEMTPDGDSDIIESPENEEVYKLERCFICGLFINFNYWLESHDSDESDCLNIKRELETIIMHPQALRINEDVLKEYAIRKVHEINSEILGLKVCYKKLYEDLLGDLIHMNLCE